VRANGHGTPTRCDARRSDPRRREDCFARLGFERASLQRIAERRLASRGARPPTFFGSKVSAVRTRCAPAPSRAARKPWHGPTREVGRRAVSAEHAVESLHRRPSFDFPPRQDRNFVRLHPARSAQRTGSRVAEVSSPARSRRLSPRSAPAAVKAGISPTAPRPRPDRPPLLVLRVQHEHTRSLPALGQGPRTPLPRRTEAPPRRSRASDDDDQKDPAAVTARGPRGPQPECERRSGAAWMAKTHPCWNLTRQPQDGMRIETRSFAGG
jgi:hypothetical protein